MQIGKWQIYAWIVYAAIEMSHRVDCREDHDVDKYRYICGDHLNDELTILCKSFNNRHKRDVHITTECCNGLGCTTRYLAQYYCEEIKSEYEYLLEKPFEGRPDVDRENSMELQKRTPIMKPTTPKTMTDSQSLLAKMMRANGIRKDSDDNSVRIANITNGYKHLRMHHLISRMNLSRHGDRCRCGRRHRKPSQMAADGFQGSSKSGSYVGTDHVADNKPVMTQWSSFRNRRKYLLKQF